MITIEKDGRVARAILLDTPRGGVAGIAECGACEWRTVITCEHPTYGEDGCMKDHSKEIELFMREHPCGRTPSRFKA